MHSVRRMGIGAVATVLDLWLNRQLELTESQYDELCERLVDLLGSSRDEIWRLRRDGAERDTAPDNHD